MTDLYAALACADALEEKYAQGGVTFELQAANQLRLLCDEVGALRDEIAVAIAAEREACAKVAEAWGSWIGDGQLVAAAIRTRGEK